MTVKNAVIKDTMLGYEDHGILTCDLVLDYGDSSQQSFGGYSIGGEYCAKWVKGLLDVVGVNTWEKLKGQHVRVQIGNSVNPKISAIGNFLKDKWFEAPKS